MVASNIPLTSGWAEIWILWENERSLGKNFSEAADEKWNHISIRGKCGMHQNGSEGSQGLSTTVLVCRKKQFSAT